MKALALEPFYATLVAAGEKDKEYRSWNTKYRGDLLICSTLKKDLEMFPRSYALCIVEISDTTKTKTGFTWCLKNLRHIKPFKVRCNQRIFNIDCNPEIIHFENTEELLAYWESLKIANFD